MNKKLVILVSVVAVLAVAIGVAGFYMGYTSFERKAGDNDGNDGDVTSLQSGLNTTPSEDGGFMGDTQEKPQGENQGNTQSGSTQSGDLASQLIGRWRDVSGVSGFDFMKDGKVTLTYVDLGFVGINFAGDLSGVYTLEGDKLTINTSFYAGTTPIEYTASVSGDTLTLISTNSGGKFTYTRSGDTDTNVGGDVAEPEQSAGIVGDWKDGMGMSGFNFKEDGTVSFTYIDLQFIGFEGLSGSYDGTYTVDGDNVTISFSVIYGPTFTLKFTYEISDSTLMLTNEKGTTTTYIRQ